MPTPLRFRIPGLMPTKAVTTALQARWNVVAEPSSAVRRTFLDTADWRVYRGGWTLEMDHEPSASSTKEVAIVLRDAGSEAVLASTTFDGAPGFAGDLPASSPWSEVAEAVGDRRLLCQLEMDSHLHRISVRNDDDKIIAKVVVEWHRVVDQAGRHHLMRVATVTPVRGYERTTERMGEALLDAGLQPQERSLLPSALTVLDRPQPGSKLGPGVELERSMPAAQAVGAILGRLRYHLLSNEAGVREQLDIEFLHEYRVAIRRARSILGTVRGVLLQMTPRRWRGSSVGSDSSPARRATSMCTWPSCDRPTATWVRSASTWPTAAKRPRTSWSPPWTRSGTAGWSIPGRPSSEPMAKPPPKLPPHRMPTARRGRKRTLSSPGPTGG